MTTWLRRAKYILLGVVSGFSGGCLFGLVVSLIIVWNFWRPVNDHDMSVGAAMSVLWTVTALVGAFIGLIFGALLPLKELRNTLIDTNSINERVWPPAPVGASDEPLVEEGSEAAPAPP